MTLLSTLPARDDGFSARRLLRSCRTNLLCRCARPSVSARLITPWNFPMAIPTWKLFPALLCGNTVVLKPAEDTPYTAVKLFEILAEAGVPPGVVNLVHGRGEEVGAALVRHADVKLVSFTGSAAVGREIASVCGQQLKRVSLELGGKNAQIVMEDADLKFAVEGALWGAFGTTGQRCTATSRLIVHRDIKKELTDMLGGARREDQDRRRTRRERRDGAADQSSGAGKGASHTCKSASQKAPGCSSAGRFMKRENGSMVISIDRRSLIR